MAELKSQRSCGAPKNGLTLLLLFSLVLFSLLQSQSSLHSMEFSFLAFDTTATESTISVDTNYINRTNLICNFTRSRAINAEVRGSEWRMLCDKSLIDRFDSTLFRSTPGRTAHVIQIGAHTGFEANDPLALGLSNYLKLLMPADRERFHWTFVEPSPPNYASLLENIDKHKDLCHMDAINVAIISDTEAAGRSMNFYSIRDTIDPVTGFDSISNKTFPAYITQLSSFEMSPIRFNRGVWRRLELKMEDYVVQTNVTVTRFSDLIDEVMGPNKLSPDLVLIDTEGHDCDILMSMQRKRTLLPRFLVFEHHNCRRPKLSAAITYLKEMGYHVFRLPKGSQNTVAILQDDS